MPTYRYRAVDSGGRVVSGELEALDVRQAQQQLATQGLRALQLTPERASSPQAPTTAAAPPTRRFWEHSRVPPHQMGFWLTQLRAMLKAGMSPANAFETLSQRVRRHDLQRASADIAHDAARGVALSDAMTKYPELFPNFLIGAFRAAEHGGYLPEMLERLTHYYEQQRVVHRWTRLTQGCLWHAVLLLPLIAPFGVGVMEGFSEFQGGGTATALQTIGAGVGKAFLRYGLPTMLLMIALMLLGYLITGSERLGARLRLHGLGFRAYADWVRAQSLEFYLFHLGKLTQAGIYPATAHALAACAVPNNALAKTLQNVPLGRAEDAAHLDAALERSGIFPLEEVMMARTGVQTGDLPHILEQLAQMYRQRTEERIQQLPRAFFRLISLISIIATGIAIIALAWGYYHHVFDAVDRFMGIDS
ncbi:MAG: type II secretion system F family protein [Fimbriimonadales bacterium]